MPVENQKCSSEYVGEMRARVKTVTQQIGNSLKQKYLTFRIGELHEEVPPGPEPEVAGPDAVGLVAFVGHDLPPVERRFRGPPSVFGAALLKVFGRQVDVGLDGEAVGDVPHAACG